MWQAIKNILRPLVPKAVFKFAQPYWHGTVALLSHWYFGQPSRKMTVIGITGTAGKSTTVNLLAWALNQSGYKTGFITTANSFDGEQEQVNKHGLSMPGGFLLQQQLHAMVKAGCQYAVIEATSEGLAQNRHLGIHFDAVLLTSLAPAHIEAHGSFENYRAAKGKLFYPLSENGKQLIGVNLDTQDADYFLNFPAQKKFGVTLKDASPGGTVQVFRATKVVTEPQISFELEDVPFNLQLIGQFNVYNVMLAAACAHMLGVSLAECARSLQKFQTLAGRMEAIPNDRGVQIFVDYAPEPSGMENALTTLNNLPHRRLIHVFGTTGGHRDKRKRFDFGKLSAQLSDLIIITNDDVYDSDPQQIVHDIQAGIAQAETKKVKEILTVLDRRQAISQALALAQPGDIVVFTGKGSEQFLVLPGNQRIPWDEPSVVKEELAKL